MQSNASPFTSPPGHSALTFEISHRQDKPLPVRGKRALIDACVAGLKRTDLWRDGDEVVFEQVVGMPHAYIPFTPERQGNLDVINAYLHGLGDLPDRPVRRMEVRQPGRGHPLGQAGRRGGPVGRPAPAVGPTGRPSTGQGTGRVALWPGLTRPGAGRPQGDETGMEQPIWTAATSAGSATLPAIERPRRPARCPGSGSARVGGTSRPTRASPSSSSARTTP